MDVTAPRSAPADSRASPADAPAAVVIRPLATLEDYRACVALQREIWGDAFEVVPAAILQISTHVGGVAAGAFDPDGQLVGFVFGLSGLDDGKAVHWSHVLGVRPELRNAGIGRRLKEYQRQELVRRHIGEMYWTYDPLIAKNAHFNLNVLGARVVRYAPDMYGDTGSPLHHGLATDRLVVRCDTARSPREACSTLEAGDAATPVLTLRPQPDDAVPSTADSRSPRLRLEVPADFAQLLVEAPADAKAWHLATREHFQWALGHDYVVTGFRRDPVTSRAFYMLERHPRTTAPAT